MDKYFWKDKKVFITGHTGFKGTWLTYWLCKLGAVVVGYSIDTTENSLYNDLNFENLIDIRYDILHKVRLEQEILNLEPDIIIHLAAKSTIEDCLLNPEAAYKTNVLGIVNIFESSLKCKNLRAIVCVTSDKVYYGACEKDGFTEENVYLGALEHYSATKVCQEIVADSYRNCSFKNKRITIATVRASNVLGCGDCTEGRLLVTAIKSFKNNATLEIRNPNAIRPWQNMLDCIDSYLCLAQKAYEDYDAFNEGFNIGPYTEGIQTVEWIVNELAQLWGDTASYKIVNKGNVLSEKEILRLNIEKSMNKLNWKPKHTLKDTLRQIVEFEKSVLSGCSKQHLVDNLINSHMCK